MCGPAAPAAGMMAPSVVAAPAAAGALSAAGPGMMAVGTSAAVAGPGLMATAPLAATSGPMMLAPLGASFTSAAPIASTFGFAGIKSLISDAADVMDIVSPVASGITKLRTAKTWAEMGRMQADSQRITMNQQILDRRMLELERREKANAELASMIAGGQPGQSLVALTQKKLDDNERSRQFSETAVGAIGITGRTRIATTQGKTKTAVDAALKEAGKDLGQATGFLRERFA